MQKINTGFDNKRLAINMIFSIMAFLLNTAISFFVTPYITGRFGSEAYGFIKLSMDFINYASLITIALNSMSSRFIMLKREQDDIQSANSYYSSLMVANLFLAVVIGTIFVFCIIFLEKIISIPSNMVLEVKITFAITFTNFIIGLITSIYGNCFYLSNRLDLSAIRNSVSTIIRVITIIILFLIFKPRISYVVIGSLFATVYLSITNFFASKKLVPDLNVKRSMFSFSKIKELTASGIWSSITKLSQIFSSGLDLLITNVFVGSRMMGYLSVAKTIPTLITSFNATIAAVFSPNLMILYSKNDIEGLKKAIKSAMRFMCVFVSIPNAILISMGTEFFELWVPGQPTKMINILSILTVINSCVTGPTQPLYQVFTITNKIKQSSIVMIIYGFTSLAVTLLCLNVTNMGVYAVAGVSFFGSIVVATFYHIPFAAKYLGLPKRTFFPEIGISVISMAIITAVGFVINILLNLSSSWIIWFLGAFLTGIIGLALNMMLILSKQERKTVIGKLFKRKSAIN